MSLEFEWDRGKGKSNFRKHGVSFIEAATVFIDPLARIFNDEEHSVDERREIIVGHSSARRVLLVAFVERRPDRVRIISARCATKKERKIKA